jgi:hypothetical protein
MLPDWIELLRSFAARSVEFLLIGGQAVIAHGYPHRSAHRARGPEFANKKAVGRLQDLADVEALEAIAPS